MVKNRILSLLLCVCLVSCLITDASLAAAQDSPTGKVIAYADSIPEEYSGTYLILNKVRDGLYGITVGIRNIAKSQGWTVNLQYDTGVVKPCKSTGADITNISQAVSAAKYSNEMLTESGKASGYTDYSVTDASDGMGIFDRAILTSTQNSELVEGQISISYSMLSGSESNAAYVIGLQSDPLAYTPPENINVNFYTVYFTLIDNGVDINADTFTLYEGYDSYKAGAAAYVTVGMDLEVTSYGACLVGFPPPEVASYKVPISVKNTSNAAVSSVSVKITDSEGKEVSGSPFTSAAETGGLNNVVLPAGDYSYTATPSQSDSTLYAVTNGSFTVTAPTTGEEADAVTITMDNVAPGTTNVTIKVVDGDNGNAIIPTAQVNLGNTEKSTTDGIVLYELTDNSYTLQVAATGYETFGSTTENIITVGNGVTFDSAYNNSLSYDAESQTLTVVMSAKRTAITIPIPVPASNGTAIDVSQAKNLKVTISANPDGSTPATLALPITVTTTADGAGNQLSFTPDSGAMTSLSALVNLPKGNYIITVSGAGIESLETTLNVVPSASGTTVNVGGAVFEGVVNGGYTDTTSNSAIDLGTNSGSATTGGTVNQDGTASGGTSVSGGLLDNAASAGLDGGITVISDPLYYVVGTWDNDKSQMTVEVYLKNIKATMGTFGLKYDTNVFTGLSDTNGFNFAEGLSAADYGTSMGLNNPTTGAGYHSFYWTIGSSADPVDATGEAKLIATYKLVKKSGVDLSKLMHNEALTVIPFGKTEAGEKAKLSYGDKVVDYEYFASEYWRETSFTADNANRNILGGEKATAGGFYQAYNTAEGSNPVKANDVRSQFVFEDYGNVAVHILVSSTSGSPVNGADVTLSAGGTELKGKTDKNGEAIISCPPNTTQEVKISANGYLAYPQTGDIDKTVTVGTVPVTKEFKLTPQQGHPVKVVPQEKVTLSGEPKAYNTVDYYFTLNPAPGYEWKNGMPAPGTLTIKLTDVNSDIEEVDETLTATWSAARNMYMIAGNTIKGSPASADADAGDITITVPDNALQHTSNYKITATAGAGGTVSKEANASATNNSSFNPDTSSKIVETLGAGESTSAKYTFKPNESGAPEGSIYVIHKIIINGAEMTPTDAQRREGYSHQFTGITGDQTITITFGTMPEDGGDITPAGNDQPVTVIVGDYGKATVKNGDADEVALDGSATGTYIVAADTSMTIKAEADQSVTQPDGNTQSYEIDKVMVNGVQVNGETAGTGWDAASSTLTLSGLTEPAAVVITFKPTGGESIQAIVESSVVSGRGAIISTGTNVYTVGDRPAFTLAPEGDNWKVDSLKLTTPGAEAPADVTDQISAGKYTASALAAGVTKLEAAFAEQTYQVKMLVDLSNGGVSAGLQKSPVKMKFVRTAGGEPITLSFENYVVSGANVSFSVGVPEGTWTVTVSKNGYLNYEIKGFTVNSDGTVTGTAVSDGYIYFGVKSETANPDSAKAIKLTIGDASWDGNRVSPIDAAQVVNGMIAGATAGMMDRADIDETGANGTGHNLTADMGYVKLNYGKLCTSRTYSEFLDLTYSTAS